MFKPFANLIIKAGQRLEEKSFLTSDQSFSILGDAPTQSGKLITGQNALNVPAVLHAVRLISETIGSLPCKLYTETRKGKSQAKDHSAFRLVHSRANEWTSAGKLRQDLTKDALLHGGGFARVIRLDDGKPFELHRIQPEKVTVLEDSVTGAPVYRVQEASGSVDYSHKDILHIPAFAGVSPVKYGREAIGIAAILEDHSAKLFASGARPAGIITFEKTIPHNELGEKTISRIYESFKKSSRKGFESPPVLDAGANYKQMALTSTDSQFIENRLEQINEIARIFGVPPSMLYQLDRATWSNAEEMSRSFLQLCLRPWIGRWQDSYATVLLEEGEQDDFYFEFVIDDLQSTDAAARAEIFSKLISARVMTPNEVRAAMNLPALEGGDELVNPFTTSTLLTDPKPVQPKE